MTTLREKISRLPELPVEPFEVAGKLDYSDKIPVVTIRPYKFPVPVKPPNSIVFAQNKSSAWHRSYYVQVIYPRVICQSPWGLEEANEKTTMAFFKEEDKVEPCLAESNGVIIAKQERFYKLSTLNGLKFPNPWWCSVKGGPWLAIAEEEESCLDGVPPFWRLWIIEMPEVTLSWYGKWEDIPSYPSLIVFMNDLSMFDQYSVCCAGYKWCTTTMSCIPLATNCQGTTPF
jgi:hypothetical protein